jgi:hypothetical protein
MLPPVRDPFLIFLGYLWHISIGITRYIAPDYTSMIRASNKVESMQEMAVVIQFKHYNRFWSVMTQKIHISVRKGSLSLELIQNTR